VIYSREEEESSSFMCITSFFDRSDEEKEIYQFPISAKPVITTDAGELIFVCQIWLLILH